MKLCILGHSESGKTTAAEILAELLDTKCLNTSDQLIIELAAAIGVPADKIARNKKQYRTQLFDYGRSKQSKHPSWPQDIQILEADILTGLRSPDEVKAARECCLYDLIIWIDRPGCEANETDRLTPDHADLTIKNDGSIEDLRARLTTLLSQLQLQK